MRRLFWVGVGAVGAVVAVERVRRAARRYTPAGVGDQVKVAGRATSSALLDAVGQLKAAMAHRERELVDTLLLTPEAGDAGAVFGRHGRDADGWGSRRNRDPSPWAQDATRSWAATAHTDDGTRARPAGRVDDEDSLHDF